MIKSVFFKNYKAFREGEIELRPITLIVGKNSSGKSSICKLLPLMSYSLSGQLSVPFVLENNGVVSGARYIDLFRNQETTGLSFGVEIDRGDRLESQFYIKGNKPSVYSMTWQSGDGNQAYSATPQESESIKGMFPNSFLSRIKINRQDIKLSVDYISPIRRAAQYAVPYKGEGSCHKVGYDGANAYDLLIDSYLGETSLYKNVSKWMESYLEGQRLEIKRLGADSEVFGFYIVRGHSKVNMADVGQGVSQLLPIIVHSFLPAPLKADVTVIEQPALHLHPAAHASVAERLALSALHSHRRYVIESHSGNILLSLRKMISDSNCALKSDDVIVYYVDNDFGEADLERITIGDDGRLSSWPEGVFSEGFDLLASIYRK